MPFSRNSEGKIEQRRFGGHTRNFGEAPVRRACYASDRTGRVIMDALYDHCLVRGVKIFNEVFVTSLMTSEGRCCGVAGYELATGEASGFSCKSGFACNGRLRQNLQNNFDVFCGYRRRLCFGLRRGDSA